MVERFHRHLKEALKVCHESPKWTLRIPLILLGIRLSYKEELKGSPAEMVYGQNLRLPSEVFLPSTGVTICDTPEFIANLKKAFRSVEPTSPKHNSTTNYYKPKTLETCKRVFVRIDKVRTGLQAPYEGPYLVIRRCRKFYVLKIKDKNESISIDRLKPAFESEEAIKPPEISSQPKRRKHVRFQT